jgi:hypothetical protein
LRVGRWNGRVTRANCKAVIERPCSMACSRALGLSSSPRAGRRFGCQGLSRLSRNRSRSARAGLSAGAGSESGLSRQVSRSGPFRSLSACDLVGTSSRAARSHTTSHSRNAARQRFLTLSAGSLLSARRRRRPALAPLLREACDELEELWRVQHGLETLRRLGRFYQVYGALHSDPGVARAARTAARHPYC